MRLFISRAFAAFMTATLIGLAACSSMEVHTAKAPNVDLAQYKTYSWIPADQGQNKPAASILDQKIRASIEQQMAAKGLSPADSPRSADLFVSYTATSKVNNYGATYDRWGWDWGGLAPTPTHQGTLSLQLIDPKANKVVWTGTASDVISESGENQKQIVEAVKDLFKKYPTT